MRIDRVEDRGSFRCVATNVSSTYAIITEPVRFTVNYLTTDVRVVLKTPSSSSSIGPGSDVTLRCDAAGDPPPAIEWYKNGIRLFESADKMALRRKQLTVLSVTSEDNGSFTCRAVARSSSSSAPRAIRASFSLLWNRSTRPLASG